MELVGFVLWKFKPALKLAGFVFWKYWIDPDQMVLLNIENGKTWEALVPCKIQEPANNIG